MSIGGMVNGDGGLGLGLGGSGLFFSQSWDCGRCLSSERSHLGILGNGERGEIRNKKIKKG